MTMPKFEPVAFTPLPVAVSRGNLGTYLFDAMQMHQYAMRYLDLHADQLAEAYEAGKRDAIPEGWVLVPKVATEEMLVAGRETPCTASDDDWRDDYADVYKSMLTAAPKGEE